MDRRDSLLYMGTFVPEITIMHPRMIFIGYGLQLCCLSLFVSVVFNPPCMGEGGAHLPNPSS